MHARDPGHQAAGQPQGHGQVPRSGLGQVFAHGTLRFTTGCSGTCPQGRRAVHGLARASARSAGDDGRGMDSAAQPDRADDQPYSVRLSDPGDLAAGIPHLLGFHPRESVVLISLGRAERPPGGADGAGRHPAAASTTGRWRGCWPRSVRTDRPDAVVLVARVSEAADEDGGDRAPAPAARARADRGDDGGGRAGRATCCWSGPADGGPTTARTAAATRRRALRCPTGVTRAGGRHRRDRHRGGPRPGRAGRPDRPAAGDDRGRWRRPAHARVRAGRRHPRPGPGRRRAAESWAAIAAAAAGAGRASPADRLSDDERRPRWSGGCATASRARPRPRASRWARTPPARRSSGPSAPAGRRRRWTPRRPPCSRSARGCAATAPWPTSRSTRALASDPGYGLARLLRQALAACLTPTELRALIIATGCPGGTPVTLTTAAAAVRAARAAATASPSTCSARNASTVSYQTCALPGREHPVVLVGEVEELRRDAALLQVVPEPQRLADRHAVVLVAVDDQHRRADRVGVAVRGVLLVALGLAQRVAPLLLPEVRRVGRAGERVEVPQARVRDDRPEPVGLRRPPSWPCSRRTSRPSPRSASRRCRAAARAASTAAIRSVYGAPPHSPQPRRTKSWPKPCESAGLGSSTA